MAKANELYAESGGQKYRLRTLPDFRVFRTLALTDDETWTTHSSGEKLTIQWKPPGDNSTKLNIVRARCIMEHVPPQVLYDQLQDARYRETWDDNMIEGYNIVQLDPYNDVGYYAAKFPWPLANRDFCNMRSWMEFTNGEYVIFNHSEPHSSCPEKKNFIRARSILTGYYMQPYDGGKGTVLTYVTHFDPCGFIPHAAINFTMSKRVLIILNKLEKSSELYPEFMAKTYPQGHVFPWRTPKISWDSKYLNPEDEKAASKSNDSASSEQQTQINELSQRVSAAGNVADGVTIETTAIGSPDPTISLAPVGPSLSQDTVAIQQYRAIMQDALNSVDRSFLREGRAPTAREYALRVKFILQGMRATS